MSHEPLAAPAAPTTAALQLVAPGTYSIVAAEDNVRKMLQTLQDLAAGAFDLPLIKLPAGEGTFWQLPDEHGELQAHKSLTGVLAAVQMGVKGWWAKPYAAEGGGTPPDCESTDGRHGRGINRLDVDPVTKKLDEAHRSTTHDCFACPWNQFGSARKDSGVGTGAGKDCKDQARLVFFRPGDFVPFLILGPATSLKALKKYHMDLAQQNLGPAEVETTLTLRTEVSTDGFKYPVLQFSRGRKLPPAEGGRMRELGQQFVQRVLLGLPVTAA